MYIEYISFFLSTYLRRGDKMSEIFEFKEAVLTIHLPQELDHPQSDRIRKETDRIMSRAYIKKIIFDFENTEFMIGILHTEKTSDSMSKSLDSFQEILSDKEYEQLFSVLLTDRGTEFIKSQQFEVNIHTGEIRGKIFYCDPMQSSQKPHVENNHNFIREVLPNGQSWNHLTQEKIDLMFSHINSTPRENLGGKTPYEIFSFIYGEELAHKLNIQKIAKDEVTTTPRLLK